MNRSEFTRLWEKPFEFSPEARLSGSNLCPYAAQLQAWIDGPIKEALENPTRMGLNRAKVLLVDKLFEWRRAAPSGHRGVVTSGRGHVCLFQVFERAYEQIHQAELRLDPPPLLLPSQYVGGQLMPSPSPVPPQIQSIFLGEEE